MAELTGSVEELIHQARDLADARGHAYAGTEHRLLAMTRQSTDNFARRLLDEVGATEPLRARIEAVIGEVGGVAWASVRECHPSVSVGMWSWRTGICGGSGQGRASCVGS